MGYSSCRIFAMGIFYSQNGIKSIVKFIQNACGKFRTENLPEDLTVPVRFVRECPAPERPGQIPEKFPPLREKSERVPDGLLSRVPDIPCDFPEETWPEEQRRVSGDQVSK